MSEPIRIYLKLNETHNAEVVKQIDENNNARLLISNSLKKETGADCVFFTKGLRHTRLSLGFKEKQDNQDFKKRFEEIEGYFVYEPKVRTATGKLVAIHEKDLNKFPDATNLVCQKYGIPTEQFIGLKVCRAVFGRPNNQVIGVIFGRSEKVTDIPEGFTEITANEFSSLNQIKEKEAA